MPLPALHLRALGSQVALSSDDPAVHAELRRLWGPLLCDPGDVDTAHRFCLDTDGTQHVLRQGTTLLASGPVRELLTVLGTHLNRLAIDACPQLTVHAGAVASDSRVVALAAESGGGKSTLTAACLKTGWSYVSDEALCLDADGGVHPYQKPLALSARSRDLLGLPADGRPDHDDERLCGLHEFDAVIAGDGLHLAAAVFLERDAVRRPSARLVRVHSAHVLTGLLQHSFNHYKRPLERVRLLAGVAAQCHAYRLQYSDAREAAELLTAELLAEPPA